MYQMLTCFGEIMPKGGAGQPANCLCGDVRRMSRSSSPCCPTSDTGFNMSHWKKARVLTPKFRLVSHLLAIAYFLYRPFPTVSLWFVSLLQTNCVPQGILRCFVPRLRFLFYPLHLVREIFTKYVIGFGSGLSLDTK